jgi:hypothetical protein
VGDGARAHGAGLERDVKVAAVEATGAADGEGLADGFEFRMGRGVVGGAHPVAEGG